MENLEYLKKLRTSLEIIKTSEYNKESIEEILNLLIPRNSGRMLVDYKISDEGMNTAIYYPNINTIKVSVNKSKKWLDTNNQELLNYYKIEDSVLMREYLSLFMLVHELMHSEQFLISRNKLEFKECLRDAYKYLIDYLFFKKDYIIPMPILKIKKIISQVIYSKGQNFYIFERNANIEAAKYLSNLALLNDDKNISDVFIDMKDAFEMAGYTEDSMGAVYHTYKDILLLSKYKKIKGIDELSEEEAFRYGFAISPETREKILKKV